MSGFVPLNAGYTVPVRRTRLNALLNVLVLLTLVLSGESPTLILHDDTHLVTRAIEVSRTRSKYHTHLSELSFGQKCLLGRSHT